MEKTWLVLLGLYFFVIGCASESGSSDHSTSSSVQLSEEIAPNAPYQRFCQGYETLNAKIIAETYAQEAILLNLYNGSSPSSFQGRDSIGSFFMETFNTAKERGLGLEIVFKVTMRQEQENQILDNGFYRLNVTSTEQATDYRYGKFSIVLEIESGLWKFAVDANASATEEEFKEATGTIIGSKGRQ